MNLSWMKLDQTTHSLRRGAMINDRPDLNYQRSAAEWDQPEHARVTVGLSSDSFVYLNQLKRLRKTSKGTMHPRTELGLCSATNKNKFLSFSSHSLRYLVLKTRSPRFARDDDYC